MGPQPNFFGSLKGLRQGDPLLLMLFLVMMEVFSRMMKRVEGAGLLRGFRVAGRQGGGVGVSHLLFVDDTILFCDANEEQIDRKSTRLNSSHSRRSRMPSSA